MGVAFTGLFLYGIFVLYLWYEGLVPSSKATRAHGFTCLDPRGYELTHWSIN